MLKLDLPIICINIRKNKERRKYIERIARKKNLKIKFYYVDRHPTDPKRGCLESHLGAIEYGISKKWDKMMIIEDDIKLINPLHVLSDAPDDFDMLYLGGTVRSIMECDLSQEIPNNTWLRCSCWTTHAYIINLKNNELIGAIKEALNQEAEIDTFYSDVIHPKFRVYMHNPMVMIQKPGWSDIEQREVNYDFMKDTIRGFRKPEHRKENGEYILKLSDVDAPLPKVSIITPTFNRKHIFVIAINNWRRINYPKELLEWIIIDDSTPEYEEKYGSLSEIVPKGDNVHYHNIRQVINKQFTISNKRNIGADLATGEIIIHMDDDDYYPEHSVYSRVRILQKYASQDIGCVGSSLIGTYNILTNKSSYASDGVLSLSEASMGYFKRFWEKQKWDNEQERGEYRNFIANRVHKVIDIPYSFTVYGINHNDNYTKRLSKDAPKYVNNKEKEFNFIDIWDEDSQLMFYDIGRYLLSIKDGKI